MAGRDWPVTQTSVRLPEELLVVIKSYQNARRMSSLNQAVTELLESHPEIRRIVSEMLDANVMSPLS